MTKRQESATPARTGANRCKEIALAAPVSHCGMDDGFESVRFLPEDELLGIAVGIKWVTGKRLGKVTL